MRKLSLIFGLIAALTGLSGCEDSHNTDENCEKACGHGTCYLKVTQENCMCDAGYSIDGDGACTVPDMPTLQLSGAPVFENGNVTFKILLKDEAGIAKNPKFIVSRDGKDVHVAQSGFEGTISDTMAVNINGKTIETKKASYSIKVTTDNDLDIAPIFLPVWNEQTAFDWKDAVIYFAFIDRFNNGNTANDNPLGVAQDWRGGDFEGLRQKVEEGYFSALGVNTLWISSVSMNTQKPVGQSCGYHSYWPVTTGYTDETAEMFAGYKSNGVDITPIEPHFGTLDELRALVETCHAHGMRVLVDFAANHVDEDSPVYIKHPEWFNNVNVSNRDDILCEGPRKDDGSLSQGNWNNIPETCWFSDNLPDFNYELPEVRKFTVDHAKWLIRTTNIDGFRLDAVKHMYIQFIKDLRHGIDEMFEGTGTTFYIVGETFDGEYKIKQYIGDDLLHGQFDFPLYNVLRSTIMNGDGKFWELKDFVINNDSTYGSAIMSTFLGNHDVARAISHIHHDAEDKVSTNLEVTDTWAYRQLRLAWTFLFTSPMLPMIYYGDEYGLEGANDPDNRRMMEFGNDLNDEQKKTLQLVQKLGQLRRQHPVFAHGTRHKIDAYARAYTYLMKDENETILVGICDADDDQTFSVPEGVKGWIDLMDESNTVTATTSITLNKDRQIIIWKLKD